MLIQSSSDDTIDSMTQPDILKSSFSVSEDCVFIQDKRMSVVNIIKLNDDKEYYRLSKVAAEIFMEMTKSPRLSLGDIINLVSTKYPPKHHDTIALKSIEMTNDLLTKEILRKST